MQGLRELPLHTTLRDGAAIVRATPATGRPATFVLRPATAAETVAFRAPACAWRIATGATAVLGTTAAS